jgi:glycosyltransferase involved in cell wall biosynthesis
MPKISVIIPTYNSANYLPEAIESVLAQTYKNFEIVVIDDGSTDNTKEVVVPYLDQIVFLETENGDPAKARNHGIRKSSGEYVAFLDADDIWCPDKLERQLAYFSKNPHYHLVFSDAYETGVNNLQKDTLFFSILGRVKPMAGFVFNELLDEAATRQKKR